jgi:hypothetical protein
MALAAAVPAATQVRLDVLGGVSRATLGGAGGEASDLTRPRSGLALGGQIEIPLGLALWFRPEIAYVQKGGRSGFDDYQTVLQADYLEMPLVLGWSGTEQQVRPEVYAGPYFGLRVSCSVRSTVAGATRTVACADSGVQRLRGSDLGPVLGAGFEAGALNAGVRFDLGMMDAARAAEPVHHRGILILAGYRLRLQGR